MKGIRLMHGRGGTLRIDILKSSNRFALILVQNACAESIHILGETPKDDQHAPNVNLHSVVLNTTPFFETNK